MEVPARLLVAPLVRPLGGVLASLLAPLALAIVLAASRDGSVIRRAFRWRRTVEGWAPSRDAI
jgi:hypothetical protein